MKRSRIPVIVGLILLAAVFGGLYRRYFYSPLGRVVVDLHFQGIILDPANYPVDPPFTGTWEVTPGEIRQMEPKLTKYVQHHKRLMGKRISTGLRNYRRQYLGLLDKNGEQWIDISLCHEDVTDRSDWLEYYSDTVGGGDYYWHITYDMYSGKFSDFFSNEPD